MSLITVNLSLVSPYGADDIVKPASGQVRFTPVTHGKYNGALRTIETIISPIVQGEMAPVELTPGLWSVEVLPIKGNPWPPVTFTLEEGMTEPVNLAELAPEIVIKGEQIAKGDPGPTITSWEDNEDGTIKFLLSDGTYTDSGTMPRGPQGPGGPQGPVGLTGPAPELVWDGTSLIIDGGTPVDLKGERGEGGVVRAYVDARTSPLQVGKNLYDPSAIVDGYSLWDRVKDDPYLANAPYESSGPIPVQAGDTLTMSGTHSGTSAPAGPRMWAFYNVSDEFILFGEDSDQGVRTVTAEQDGFLRATFRKETVLDPQIEAGATATEYEPYTVTIPGLDLALTNADIPSGVVTPDKTSFAAMGKNLLDPAAFVQGQLLNPSHGGTDPLAGYTISGFFPVTGGTSYTGVMRVWAFYTSSGAFINGTNTGSNSEVTTVVAPNGAALMRASWPSSRDSIQQIEQGTTATEFEPYGIHIPALVTTGGGSGVASTGPIQVTATASGSAQIRSHVGSQPLTIDTDLRGSRNGTFNLVSATLGGTFVSTAMDEISPLRTFNTVGANHGYTAISAITVAGHGKTVADLGSVWTDGERQWTLLLIDGDTLTLGPQYTVYEGGVATASSAPPVAALTHVSGATSTDSIPIDTVASGAQLYPSVQRVHTTLLVDGRPVSDGEHHGVTAQVRESYEVLDYASIIDTAQANIGTPFHEVRVKGAVRVESIYTFKPGLTLVDTALTELAPTTLGSCGFVQALHPSGTGGRIVPGVTGWITPKSFSGTWERKVVTTADLIDPTIPPVMSLDMMDWGGFALGYFPHAGGVTSSAERIENGGSRLWDLRDTKKSYPSPWASKPAGWGRVEAHAYRAYLTPEQAAEVAAVAEDAHAAHSALAAVTGL